MIITAHEGQDNEEMVKIIGTCPYVTAVGEKVLEGFSLYAKDKNGLRYSVKTVSTYKQVIDIKKEIRGW